MLHILFLILKIIGIILLVILGITLTLIGVVLLVPIRYRMKTETTNGMKGLRTEVKANWLLHLISAHITYQEEELDWQVRVGWKKFQAGEEDAHIDDGDIDINAEEEKNAHVEMSAQDKRAPREEGTTNREETTSKATSSEKSKKRAVSKEEKEGCFKKIKCTIREFCDKIKNIKEFLMDETHIQAFLRLKKELLFFIRKIKPDKINGYLRFGLEDPYNTGRVLAALSMLYPFYGEHFEVYPEFERVIIEGDIYFKGRIHLVHLLLALGRAYFDKNIKTAYENLKALKG